MELSFMKRFRQPEAFAMVQQYYAPLVFSARMDSPSTIRVMLIDETAGESLLLTGLPCRISLSQADITGLINAIDLDAAALRPALLSRLKRPRLLG
jgi:hypothetical protein